MLERGLGLVLSVMRAFRRFWSGKWYVLVYKHHRVPLAVVRRINYGGKVKTTEESMSSPHHRVLSTSIPLSHLHSHWPTLGSITSWEIDGETVETVTYFTFLGSKITADGDFSHDIKRRLLLGRKVLPNLDSILNNRDITLPTKVHLVNLWFFQ